MNRHSPISRIALFTLCLGVYGCDKLGLGDKDPTGPSGPPAAGSAIVYDALGASDADGVGSSVECVPFTECPNGMGYPQVAARQLKSQSFDVSLINYGIPTAVIGPGFQTLGQQFGRTVLGNLISNEMPFVRKTATLVTVFAGGNDVNTITAALGGGAGAGNQAGFIDLEVNAFRDDYVTLLNGIRNRASSARIILLNLPNLAGLPFLAGAPLTQRQAAQRASVGMTTTAVNPQRSNDIIVIDLMCDPRSYNQANYSGDGFHPNDAGYAFIASELVRAATSTSYPAPSASCSFMTLVP